MSGSFFFEERLFDPHRAGRFVNITDFPGTNGELFFGEFASEQNIEGRKPARHLLVRDLNGRYRLASLEEANKILRKYGLPLIEEENEDLGKKDKE